MGTALVKNNAFSTLFAGIDNTVGSFSVANGTGAKFPSISGTDFFYVTLINSSGLNEIVKVIARSTDAFTVTRGQDGTAAIPFLAGDRVELRPTAALFDDKLSLGGGTLTGALAVPSGATTTQAPQVQEVVKKTGDTMSGTLIVPELRGPSNVINVPTGHKITTTGLGSVTGATVGSIVAPGMIIQTQTLFVDALATYSATGSGGEAELTSFASSFTPKFATSKVLIGWGCSGEHSTSNHTFHIKRNGTKIGHNTTAPADYWYGWMPSSYDGNETTTPQHNYMAYVDSPATTSAIAYTFWIRSSGANAVIFYQNQSSTIATSGNEVVTSYLIIQEIAG
jgi:hypothetical protein